MGQSVHHVTDLPGQPLDAAAAFHDCHLPALRAMLAGAGEGDDIAIVMPVAGHEHAGWRLATVQELAREAAPVRVNAIAGSGEDTIAEALAYLAAAPGVTGQIMSVDENAGGMG